MTLWHEYDADFWECLLDRVEQIKTDTQTFLKVNPAYSEVSSEVTFENVHQIQSSTFKGHAEVLKSQRCGHCIQWNWVVRWCLRMFTRYSGSNSKWHADILESALWLFYMGNWVGRWRLRMFTRHNWANKEARADILKSQLAIQFPA